MSDSGRSPADLRPSHAGPLMAGALAVLLLLVLTLVRAMPQERLPADAPADRFSEGRARAVLETVLAEDSPHSIGTAANARVREAIVAELASLGLEAELQEGFACGGGWGSCGPVTNVVARLPGRRDSGAILLSTHHDSVGAGPGASDAAASVAVVLEVARALLHEGPLERPVVLLLNDGEEAGLLGARAFVDRGELRDVFAVVNLEARGTTGASALFETGPNNSAFVRAWSRRARHPVTSSTLYDLYTLLPSDTDLTVYKAAGRPGLNFAFADALPRYHTPLDDLEHVDPSSLQHQGDNALAAVRALASLPDESLDGPDSAWLDVLSLQVLQWPQALSLPLTLLALALTLAAALLCWRTERLDGRQLAWALPGTLLSLALPLLAGHGIVLALQSSRGDVRPWTAHPQWATLAVASAAVLAALAVSALVARRCSAFAWWSAFSLWLGAASVAACFALPGAAPHALIPALASSATLLLAALLPTRPATSAWLLGVLLLAWPWLSIAHALHVMVGLDLSVAASLPAALIATALGVAMPAERSRWLPPATGIIFLLLGWIGAMIVPRYSQELPRHANLIHLEDVETDRAWWLTGGNPPAALSAALGGERVDVENYPWAKADRSLAASAPAPVSGALGPALDVLARHETDFGRELRLRLRSRRGADIARLRVPAEARLRAAWVEEQELSVQPGRDRSISLRGLPRHGVVIILHLETLEAAEVVVEDRKRQLPPESARLLQSRPPDTQPVHDGDLSIVYRVETLR